jgi:hypothetical protein
VKDNNTTRTLALIFALTGAIATALVIIGAVLLRST